MEKYRLTIEFNLSGCSVCNVIVFMWSVKMSIDLCVHMLWCFLHMHSLRLGLGPVSVIFCWAHWLQTTTTIYANLTLMAPTPLLTATICQPRWTDVFTSHIHIFGSKRGVMVVSDRHLHHVSCVILALKNALFGPSNPTSHTVTYYIVQLGSKVKIFE